MRVVDAYLDAAGEAVTLLGSPEVAAAWPRPSALTGLTVGGLAGHLAHQLFSTSDALAPTEAPTEPPIPLLTHYARATWIDAPLDGEANVGIRERSEGIGAEGPAFLAGTAGTVLSQQRAQLPELPPDRPVLLPANGWALRLEDFLVTRLLELAVHLDDLAVSVGHEEHRLSDAALDPVLALLARLAARRHGGTALLRALTRVERAPSAINAI
ncbi:maleylpyruvate isomerase N-terminal domain-containing protein [Streptomyces sp. DSM 44915]|uniref:Maleylpyruvate isomerase N-terminal domain-containing protein n=1 Tax=Streptomyces chisholmiae TaxID=3075540 RepID=A0ABU2JJS5_9ACTN|nr:maleylpyruvate isomerase N-terminal domain-containing protein [Streptomyces sp. DSM 44915]MDT0264754.1 maleylpyruvate isomerase N-terminal domain-containing protein [Streptomyces sp. DSM 44915]